MMACRHRDLVKDCALVHVSESGEQSFFKILYASQQPYFIGVGQTETTVPEPQLAGLGFR